MVVSEKPTIAITNPYIWPHVRRGSERLLNDLSHYLAAKGYPIEVYTMAPRAEIWNNQGIRYTTVKQKYSSCFRQFNDCHYFAFALSKYLKSSRASIVHCLNYFDAFAAIQARRQYGLNYRICFHTVGIPTTKFFRAVPLDKWFFYQTLKHADVVFALSHFAQNLIRKEFNTESELLPPPVVMPNEDIPFLGDTMGDPVLLFVGDLLEPRKGAMLTIRAFQRIKKKFPNSRLILSGRVNDDFKLQVQHLPGVASILPSIEFTGLGTVDGLSDLYRQATLTILPSVWEAFGLVLIESLAVGTPVVGTAHAGITDIISDERIGRLFDAGEFSICSDNLEGLTRAIEEVIELAEQEETANLCRRRAHEFSWEIIGPRYEQFYGQLLQSNTDTTLKK